MKTFLVVSTLLLAIVSGIKLSGDYTGGYPRQHGGVGSSFPALKWTKCATEFPPGSPFPATDPSGTYTCEIPAFTSGLYVVAYGEMSNYIQVLVNPSATQTNVKCSNVEIANAAYGTSSPGSVDPLYGVVKNCYFTKINVSSTTIAQGQVRCNNYPFPVEVISCPTSTTSTTIDSPVCYGEAVQVNSCFQCGPPPSYFPVTNSAPATTNYKCFIAQLPYGSPNNADF